MFLKIWGLLPLLFTSSVDAAPKTPSVETLLSGVGDVIWSIEFLEPQKIIFSEKKGSIKIFDLQTKKLTDIKNPPQSTVWGQGGLMDLHLHPDFKKNKTLYITYTKKVGDAYTTALAMAKLEGNRLIGLKDLFIANNPNTNTQHFGSRIVHDEKGFLYFSVGDRGERELAQQLGADQGKIHRLKLDGSTPKANPFVARKNARKTIWSYGHRNPQGLTYDFKRKILWEQEHGPRGGDEINKIEKGLNYGWPIITYGREYSGPRIGPEKKEGLEQPIHHYTPSIAPSGLALHQGDLYSGALKLTHLNRLHLSDDAKVLRETRWLEDLGERIRDVIEGPDGRLYLSTDSGEILRFSPKQKN